MVSNTGPSRGRQDLGGVAVLLLVILSGCGTVTSAPAGPGSSGIDSSATALRAVFTDRPLQEAVQIAAGGPDSLLTLDRAARLTQLDAAGRGITTLAGIDQLSGLQVLILRDNRISELSPLSTLTELRYLDLENNQVTSLVPLAGLTGLEGLILDHNQIKDPLQLLGLTALRTVSLRGNPLDAAGLALVQTTLTSRGAQVDVEEGASADTATAAPPADTAATLPITPFADAQLDLLVRRELGIAKPRPLTDDDLATLTTLIANNQAIHDLSGAERLTGLKVLDLTNYTTWKVVDGEMVPDSSDAYRPVSRWNQVRDLRPLAGLTRLERLNLGLNPLEELSPLTGLVNLSRLNIGPCQVTDLSPLAGLHELISLVCTSAPVSDLMPLAGLAKLAYLSMEHCRLRDLSPLAGLTRLEIVNVSHNQIEDISPLLHVSLRVYLKGNPLGRESLEVHVPALRARGVTVYLTE